MIERYSLVEMSRIWSPENKYQCWLEVELAACKAMNKLGIIPNNDLLNILEKANFNVNRIEEIEKTTKHDVIAFLTNVAEYVGESSRWIHFGMTSSDMLDTATAIQCKQAGELLLTSINSFLNVVKNKAIEYKDTVCIGRTHGIHAEPTSFGLKFLLWFDEMNRNYKRLENAIKNIAVGKISGAVGNYAHLSPEIEMFTCRFLSINPANISTQVIQRDNHADFLSTIAIIGTTIDKIATEIRHLQRTEVLEVEESFTKGQKGSSAMPHKKNPIVSEQMSGLARILRANSQAALENNALWHERDISHSSVERIILPDSTILLHYMLNKMESLIENLIVYKKNIDKNLELTNGLVFSQVLLLKLAEKGISREISYEKVQNIAMNCWENKIHLRQLIENDNEFSKLLNKDDLDEIFSYSRYLKNIDTIYERCFKQ